VLNKLKINSDISKSRYRGGSMRIRGTVFLLLTLALTAGACGPDHEDPNPENPPPSPAGFSTAGSGAFGCWIQDPFGLPAYRYVRPENEELNRYNIMWDGQPAIAADHWHQVGNFRIAAMAYADGSLRFFDATRGPKWVSREGRCQVRVDGHAINGQATPLVFGMGYVQRKIRSLDVTHVRTVHAPYGDLPVLMIEHRIENRSSTEKTVRIRETWDGSMQQITWSPLGMYGLLSTLSENQRTGFMRSFEQEATYRPVNDSIVVDTRPRNGTLPGDPGSPEKAAEGDYYPGSLALMLLDGPATSFGLERDPAEDPSEPIALPGDPLNPVAGPFRADRGMVLAELTRELVLGPGEQARVRFAVAYEADAKMAPLLDRISADPTLSLEETAARWKNTVLWSGFTDAAADQEELAAMAREMSWHGYYLLSAANYEAYSGVHTIDQCSAYGYLVGLRAATRDNLLNAIAALPLKPELAREQIEYALQLMFHEDARLAYGSTGFGMATENMIHSNPSDLQMWLLWAIVEYVQLTRDFEFLNKPVRYYPVTSGKSSTVLERMARMFTFVSEKTGIGEHGMLKMCTGDWPDGIPFVAASLGKYDPEEAETSFSSAFAAYVFPRVASLLRPIRPHLAEQYENLGNQLAKAVADMYNGEWFDRGWNGLGSVFGNEILFFEHHPWVLLSGLATREQEESVLRNVREKLGRQSMIGNRLSYPSVETDFLTGSTGGSSIWMAINGLFTWAAGRLDPEYAWNDLVANSMVRHAEVYPEIWYGIWSGPDVYMPSEADHPGETLCHFANAMANFPVTNSNRHALPLIALGKLAGIETTAQGLVIDPVIPFNEFEYHTPHVGIAFHVDSVSGHIGFKQPGTVTVRLPASLNDRPGLQVTVDGRIVPGMRTEDRVEFEVPAGKVTWRVEPKN